ncbi:hypothetical protein [Pseudomonas mucidolens]|uniref:Uncharacterized protein n=1 Tax=Pseudomonas mucidolens TaxID=46679 RepID=A0A1H2NGY5_9PSED|nr:hypothetical protein [Pseudomonas mucidolens]SDV04066.1 hypothetical protein SAMN05216202_3598 [Pseudomonas mucidolens]SQH32062.1 Uncharacterised protein [Pseudomonas mucidolens]
MISEADSMLLHHQVRKRGNRALLCHETRLQLSPDHRQLVLSRYVEHYSPQGVRWTERQHRVAVSDLLRWLIAQGEPSTTRLDTKA